VYEILLLAFGLLFGVFTVSNKHRKKLIPLYISGLIVGNLCVGVDLYVNEVTYYATVYVPFTNFPLSMVIIGAVYSSLILIIQELILRNIRIHIILKTLLRIILIAILNILYPIVDLIIVRADICVFHNKDIQMLYDSLNITNPPYLYFLSAYIFFFMGVLVTGLFFILFNTIYRAIQKHIIPIRKK
jgi:hypothetical protein